MKQTHGYLELLVQKKLLEVEALVNATKSNAEHPLNQILAADEISKRCFARALRGPRLSLIGEVKRRSPALGDIDTIVDPVGLSRLYQQGGASAISVLTDNNGFGGSLEDLQEVSKALIPVPTLRKDFILHPLQLAEAKRAGASAALLIVKVLGAEQLSYLLREAERIGLETLTEVSDERELDVALEAGAQIIAVNHRNLCTFEVDLDLSDILRPLMPSSVISVAASGIHHPSDAKRIKDLGYEAILVGEALVRSTNPAELISQMIGVCDEG